MTDDEKQQEQDEIDRLLAADPNANLVEGEGTVAWLVNGKALDAAKAALSRRETGSD